METKPTFRQNNYGVKSSSDIYRNIKGIHYVHFTSNPANFSQAIEDAKIEGLKTKIIKDELFIEKKND